MATKYYSGYSGKEIDDAIAHALKLSKETAVSILTSSFGNEIDLDTLKTPTVAIMHYYKNSFDDTKSSNAIILKVQTVTGGCTEQSYVYNGKVLHRFFLTSTNTWTEWKEDSDVISVDSSENVIVSKPTMILRHGSDEIHATSLSPINT